jgi:DNA-binding NarL/FixJ family response regulator
LARVVRDAANSRRPASDSERAVRQTRTTSSSWIPARSLDDASRVLAEEASAGRLDRTAVDAVLAVADAPRPVRASWPRGLSDREVEVLRLVARGKTNKEIGTLLDISARTAQNHIAHIYDKIGAYSRADAALFAVENALLLPD